MSYYKTMYVSFGTNGISPFLPLVPKIFPKELDFVLITLGQVFDFSEIPFPLGMTEGHYLENLEVVVFKITLKLGKEYQIIYCNIVCNNWL